MLIAILAFYAIAVSTRLGLIEGQTELPAKALWLSKALSWLLYICPAALCLWSIKKARNQQKSEATPPWSRQPNPWPWLGCISKSLFLSVKNHIIQMHLGDYLSKAVEP